MRLIDCKTLNFKAGLNSPTEPYAILSHRWGDEEVSFQDFQNFQDSQNDFPRERLRFEGFSKIRSTCHRALLDNLRYVWIDTCCIDKSSSAELSEAINSMFNWYQGAKICYAYLADVPSNVDARDLTSLFASSSWFTRGWTLQELIAPSELVFYSKDWTQIGTKSGLAAELEAITGVDLDALHGEDLAHFSVAKRMSWAAKRCTTRLEDIAYCLMGIFNVNMPMLYGEGNKAFIRLQEEILKQCEDQSLFTWIASAESARRAPFRGLLASSPAEFSGCQDVVPFPSISGCPIPVAPTSRGIPLTSSVQLVAGTTSESGTAYISLNCQRLGGEDVYEPILLELVRLGGDQYLRGSPDRVYHLEDIRDLKTTESTATVYVARSAHESEIRKMPQLELQHAFSIRKLPPGIRFSTAMPGIAFSSISPLPRGTLEETRAVPEPPSPLPRVIPADAWCDFKTTIVLHTPYFDGDILFTVWAIPTAAGQSVQVYSEAMVNKKGKQTADKAAELITRPKVPSTDSVILNKKASLNIKIEPQKFHGFDVFYIDITVHEFNEDNRIVSEVPGLLRRLGRFKSKDADLSNADSSNADSSDAAEMKRLAKRYYRSPGWRFWQWRRVNALDATVLHKTLYEAGTRPNGRGTWTIVRPIPEESDAEESDDGGPSGVFAV
ncbi:heterokaryon incompatibility protein-domain-containing protein [Cercophora newfieldiana]|uniref:Heterokaryon incompatibility protein-domain-containing protein n=1 Tax=Cercophora newfieldiana TaxID=92897 RepID=A0AA40D005_9PEZI|nr:heterokaryon incompatibility protein-domain-containing protein [Cercophora newfieldiana]